MLKKIAVLGFVSGVALFLYARKTLRRSGTAGTAPSEY
jgi:hypothetical protein